MRLTDRSMVASFVVLAIVCMIVVWFFGMGPVR
jgi:hypothetical protein